MKLNNDYKNHIGEHTPILLINSSDVFYNKTIIQNTYYRMSVIIDDKKQKHMNFYIDNDNDNIELLKECVDLLKRKIFGYTIRNKKYNVINKK